MTLILVIEEIFVKLLLVPINVFTSKGFNENM